MAAAPRRVILKATGAVARRSRAIEWLAQRGAAQALRVVGGSFDGANEVCRDALRRTAGGASFGWERTTLARSAAQWAAPGLASRGIAPVGRLPLEALAARVVHRMGARAALGRFSEMVDRPGFARAIARSFEELRMGAFSAGDIGDPDLDALLAAFEAELTAAALADRALVFGEAARAVREGAVAAAPLLLVDLALVSTLEANLVAALAGASDDVLVTLPTGDMRTLALLQAAIVDAVVEDVAAEGPVASLQNALFSEAAREAATSGASGVEIFSAPGESRECVEIARRVQSEAAAGTPFDRVAVVLRAPTAYRAHLVEAFRRADIRVHFSRGTRKPDPVGRAFLSLLACAAEGLSARRFAEYLSLGEVPPRTPSGGPPEATARSQDYVPPDEELAPTVFDQSPSGDDVEEPDEDSGDEALAAGDARGGTLRAPYRWERLLVEAAVIGGLERWRRRLDGYRAQVVLELADCKDPDDAKKERLVATVADVDSLKAYALPVLEELERLPSEATWGEWVDRLSELASRTLRRPARVLSLMAELDPMGEVGPVRLDEVRLRLEHRLVELPERPQTRRFGKVFVGSPDEVRGLAFDVVFVPALAERLFPQKIVEDPILSDARRRALPQGSAEDAVRPIARALATSAERAELERLALRLAVGAATRKVVLSYPRVDLDQARPRTPSFYALEALRAVEGKLPSFTELSRRAEQVGGARLGWPAPPSPEDAIDEAEHDLALLEKVFRMPDAETVGMARYLLTANPHLGRALRFRGQRWVRRWSGADGLVEPRPEARAALAKHGFGQRSFSPTALQNYAACPYRFVLQAIHRLSPREEPLPIEELDPLQRGSLLHDVEFELHTELRAAGLLPVTRERLDEADTRLRRVVAEVSARYREQLLPAIDRVFDDAVDSLTADVREMLRREADDPRWHPTHFELSFGLSERAGKRDAESVDAPAALDIGLRLRGSIDLVEESSEGTLRATDYKTGKVRAKEGHTVVGGGLTLQPVLYAMALEKLFPGRVVEGGRLYYSTAAAGFYPVWVPLDEGARESAKAVVDTVAKAMEDGFFPAAPAKGECTYCDYRLVCGPYEEQRAPKIKHAEPLLPLKALRGRR